MRHLLSVLLLTSIITASAQKKDEINFSEAFQIDSTDYFIIPRLIDDNNKNLYGKGKGYLPWGNYNEILFYNAKTNLSKKLFNGQLVIISPFPTRRYDYGSSRELDLSGNILPQHIIYLVKTEDFNKDNGLDSDDPSYLFISTKTGENLKQITPKGFHVLSWTLSKDKKMILVKGQNDKDGNKKFGNGDDQLYYRIDLHEEMSKIQCYPISL